MLFWADQKTKRGGQNAILVNIAHILQLQHPSHLHLGHPRLPQSLPFSDQGHFYTASKKEVFWVV